jgi:hypothetical protein
MGVIVGPGGAETGKEMMLSCNPDYQSFTIKELKTMADSGRFFDERGSIFDALTGMKVKSVIRSKKEKATYDEIRILNKVPFVKVLGTFSCTGDYGWGLDEVLSKCLLKAREKTNTSNVVVRQINDIDATNSGTAIGAGAGTSVPFRDDNVGAGAVAATFGKTHSMKERVVLLEVRAYDDVIEASDVCNPPKKEEEVEATEQATLVVVPGPQVKACNPDEILKRIEQYKKAAEHCKKNCFNNFMLWKAIADDYTRLFDCTGNRNYLLAANAAYERSEKNFLTGKEPDGTLTRNVEGADDVVYNVRHNWSLTILWLNGNNEDAQTNFANKYGLKTVPENIDELK